MFELEDWARQQLELVLTSKYRLSQGQWDKAVLLRLRSYAGTTCPARNLMWSSKIFVEHFISVSAEVADKEQLSSLDTIIQLYQDPSLPTSDPAVFGCVFAFMLSLDPRSAPSTSALSRAEKAILRTAQVELLPISETLESVRWLVLPVNKLPFYDKLCSRCQLQLQALWAESIGQCNGLKSRSLGKDIAFLCRLPQYRRYLVDQWDRTQCLKVDSSPTQPKEPEGEYIKTVRALLFNKL